MQKKSFEKWLKNIKEYQKGTINARSANCSRIEEFYGDLDKQYKKDNLKEIIRELNSNNHKIPINGDKYTGTATLRSALKLYLEFKDNVILDRILAAQELNPNIHDGSYELIRETVEALSKSNINDLKIEDLDMLYSMSVGTWKMSIDFKLKRIDESNLNNEEKTRLNNVLHGIKISAENYKYENSKKDEPSIGMFGTGFFTFRGNTTDEEAKKFILLIIDIKDLTNEEEIFNILEEGFKDGISGIQAGSASTILHCLKPRLFPIITGSVIKAIVVLESKGVILNKPNLLTHYIKNTKMLREFRDASCKFKNYRVIDLVLRNIDQLIDDDEITILDLGKQRLDTIVDAFKSIGGEGRIKDVFDIVKDDPRFYYNRFKNERNAEGSMRLIIQEHSSDTQTYKEGNKDLFESVDGIGKGTWHLRSYIKHEIYPYSINFTKILDFNNLHFTDAEVLKSQISIALKSGKSIILIGPPGTGKSKIAKAVAKSYGADSKMVTAMSDWSSYDTIGGYKPNSEGSLYFEEGIFLSSFKSKKGNNINKWLIIDEINRADIDKAFGPFFSALSGDDVELGSRDDENRNIEILLEQNIEDGIEDLETQTNQYIIPKDWRIIGTMNTFDKTSLYEMSYAFMRRFAFIPVAIPKDIDDNLVDKFFKLWNIDLDLTICGQIAKIWKVINKYRKVGPAIIEDIGNYVYEGGDYTSAIVIYILPQLEGLFDTDIAAFVNELMVLGFIEDKDRLVESIEDFFNTSLLGK